jgi:Protein of unknown function (DUF1559)
MAQYSWIVRILPYIEESPLYNEISADSNRFKIAAFDPSLRSGRNDDARNVHFSQHGIYVLTCPQLQVNNYSDTRPPAASYASVGASINPITAKPIGVALTNYVAFAATHKERLSSQVGNPPEPNGVIGAGKARTLASVRDGAAFTVLITETKEASNSSWYDSSGTWVVALLPRQDLLPGLNPGEFPSPERDSLMTALNVGPTDRHQNGYGVGLTENTMRRWGPSSDHDGDTVMHCFVDGSVRPIKSDIDPFVYAAIVTPNGGEQVNERDLRTR